MRTMFALAAACALLLTSCDKADQPSASNAGANRSSSDERSLEHATQLLTTDLPIIPASGGQGDYLVTADGIWLLRGAEAVRVREVKRLSTTAPWKASARQTLVYKHKAETPDDPPDRVPDEDN